MSRHFIRYFLLALLAAQRITYIIRRMMSSLCISIGESKMQTWAKRRTSSPFEHPKNQVIDALTL